jgi:hypothetical protein
VVVRVNCLKLTIKELGEVVQLLLVMDIYDADATGSNCIHIQICFQTVKSVTDIHVESRKALNVWNAAMHAVACPEHEGSIILIREPFRNLTDKIVLLEI